MEHPVAGWSRGIGITNAGITSDGWSGEAPTARRKLRSSRGSARTIGVRLLTHLVISSLRRIGNWLELRQQSIACVESLLPGQDCKLLYHPTAQWGQSLGSLANQEEVIQSLVDAFAPRPKPTKTLSEEVSSLWRFCRQSGARTTDVYTYLCHLRDSGASAAAELSWSTFAAER